MELNYDFGNDWESKEFTIDVDTKEAVEKCYDYIINDYMPAGVWDKLNADQQKAVRTMIKSFVECFDLEEDIVGGYIDELTEDYEADAWDAYQDRNDRWDVLESLTLPYLKRR